MHVTPLPLIIILPLTPAARCPPGHGDIYPSLLGSGMLDALAGQGIKWVRAGSRSVAAIHMGGCGGMAGCWRMRGHLGGGGVRERSGECERASARGGCKYQPELNQNQRRRAGHRQRRQGGSKHAYDGQ